MAKKILIVLAGIIFMLAVVAGVTTCGIMSITEDFLKEREPEMAKYVQMNLQEQNEYVAKNLDEILRSTQVYVNAAAQENWNAISKDPEVREASIKLARSLCAAFVLHLDTVKKNLSAEDLARYEEEANGAEGNIDEFKKAMEKYKKK